MEGLIRFFIGAEAGIYLIAGIVLVVSLVRFLRFSSERRKTSFGLEQEVITKKIRSTFTMTALAAVMILAELFFVSYASVKFPDVSIQPTPTMAISAAVTDTGSILVGNPEVPTTGSGSQGGCITGQLGWKSPKEGDEIKGAVELLGTVNLPNLGFYKFEYKGAADLIWTTIAGANTPVVDGSLGGTWNSQNVTPGDFQLRIVAYNNQNNEFPACIITVHVLAP